MVLRLQGPVRVALGLAVAFGAGLGHGATQPKPLPPFGKVQEAVGGMLAEQPGYQPGDILSRSQVESLLGQLAKLGFAVPDREEVLSRVPDDGDPLVAMLRTPGAAKFMRRIAAQPHGYDRLDRLLRLPAGEQIVRDLIRGPGGDELIKYLATTPGGTALGKQLSNTPQGADFNQPTGRIYTAEALLGRLKKSYAAAQSKKAI